MSLSMIARAIDKDGRWLWTTDRSRSDEWEAEGHTIYYRRVWINRKGQSWFKPSDKWKPERKAKENDDETENDI